MYAERARTVVSVRGLAGGIVAIPLGLMLAFAAVAPIGFVHATFGAGVGLWLTGAVSCALGALGMAWLVRQWRRPVPQAVVSDIGVLGDGTAGWFNDIRWDQLRRNPNGAIDVWVATSSRSEETLQWLHFFTAESPSVPPTERKLRLLVPWTLGCLWYRNAYELRRALLLQLATRANPPLRFDPMLFVQMGLHPRHWTPMPWPWRVLALLTLTPAAALFAGGFFLIDMLPSAWWIVGILVAGLVASVLFGVAVFAVLFPEFNGDPYVFDRPT